MSDLTDTDLAQTPAPLSDAALAVLRARAEAATQGKWFDDEIETRGGSGRYQTYEIKNDAGKVVTEFSNADATICEDDDSLPWDETARCNAAHIAGFNPQTALALIAELRALRTSAASAYRRGGEDMREAAAVEARDWGAALLVVTAIRALVPGEPHD